jgi:hypothetical protein
LAGLVASGVTLVEGKIEADRAMATLSRAAVKGFRDANWLRVEAGFDPLRDRADFKLLMMDQAMPPDPFTQ